MPSRTDNHTTPTPNNKKPLVVILGPTSVGKSELAIKLAAIFNGEIISADSRLFYKGMDIGTAKPTQRERGQVNHHLIDISNPDDIWTLARFQNAATNAIQNIHSSEKLPFLVGGTGQYIRAVVEGWDVPKVKPQPGLRKALGKWAEEIGSDGLHTRLMMLDPQAAINIDPTNLRRIIRAIEVILSTGYRFSEQKKHTPPPYQVLIIGLTRPRLELYARIDERIDNMFKTGLIEEVRALLDAGYSPSLPALTAIGYREIISYLQGKNTLPDAVKEMKRRTRIFVRRQANWFKKDDPDIHWFSMQENTQSEINSLIEGWLASLNKFT